MRICWIHINRIDQPGNVYNVVLICNIDLPAGSEAFSPIKSCPGFFSNCFQDLVVPARICNTFEEKDFHIYFRRLDRDICVDTVEDIGQFGCV